MTTELARDPRHAFPAKTTSLGNGEHFVVHRRLRLLLQLRAEITKTAEELDAEIERELYALAQQEAFRRRRKFKVIALPGAGIALGAAVAVVKTLVAASGRKTLVASGSALAVAGATVLTCALAPNRGPLPDTDAAPAHVAPSSAPAPMSPRSGKSPRPPSAPPPSGPASPDAPEDEALPDPPDEPTVDDDPLRKVKKSAKVKTSPRLKPLRADGGGKSGDSTPRHVLPTGGFPITLP